MFQLIRISAWNATAYNGRFGVMAAVAPRKRQCEIAREYPAGSSVGAATTPSRWDVVGNGGTVQWENETKLRLKMMYKQLKIKNL